MKNIRILWIGILIVSSSVYISNAQSDSLTKELFSGYYGFYHSPERSYHNVQELIDKGADVNGKNADGNSLMHIAVRNNNLELLKLLYYNKGDFSIKNKDGLSVKEYAEKRNKKEIIDFVKAPKLDPYFYAEYGTFDELKESIKADLSNINKPDVYGLTLLDHAVCRNKDAVKFVNYLINKGVDLNFSYVNVLDIAVLNESIELAKLFSSTDSIKKHIRPLNVAIGTGNFEMVKLLVDKGINFNGTDYLDYKPLFYAFNNQSKSGEIVYYLIEKGADLSQKDWQNRTALHYACGYNTQEESDNSIDLKLVKLLIEKGATIDAVDEDGRTPLHYAAANHNGFEAVRLLTDKKADINKTDNYDNTPFTLAIQEGNFNSAEYMIKSGTVLKLSDSFKNSLLHIAAEKDDNTAVLKLLIANKFNVNSKNDYSETPLHLACKTNKTTANSELLLKSGAQVNISDRYEHTPLYYAAQSKNLELVKLLIANGSKVSLNGSINNDPISIAVENNSTEIIKYLIEKGANPSGLNLNPSVRHKNIEIIDLLISKYVDVNKKDHNGMAPIHVCAEINEVNIAQLLISRGADINQLTDNKQTALLIAIANNQSDMVKFLIQSGADVKTRVSSKTPLHYATENKDGVDIVKLLIENGANVNAFDVNDKTALHYAFENNNTETVQYLKSKLKIKSGKRSNALMAEKLVLYDQVPLDSLHYSDYYYAETKNLKSDLYFSYNDKGTVDFVQLIIDKMLNEEIRSYDYYDPYETDFQKENRFNPTLSSEELKKRLSGESQIIMLEDIETGEWIEKKIEAEINKTEITGAVFYDSWNFDADKFAFKKDVLAYSPIRKYFIEEDYEMQRSRYRLISYFNFDQPKNFISRFLSERRMIPIKTIKYEFPINNTSYSPNNAENNFETDAVIEKENAPYWNSHSKNSLKQIILDKVLTNVIPAYDFFTGKELNISEINERMGAVNDTVYVDDWETGDFKAQIIKNEINKDEIKSIIFIEDWFLDPQTLLIKKEVIGIAPVRSYKRYQDDWNSNEETFKSIPFAVYFKEPKFNSYDQRKITIITPIDSNPKTLHSNIINNHFYYWEKAVGDLNFKQHFITEALSGNVKLYIQEDYDAFNNFQPNLYKPVNITDINENIGIKIDTIYEIDPNTGNEIEKAIMTSGYGIDSISVINSYETWTFDKTNFKFNKDVFAYSPGIRFYRDDDIDMEYPHYKIVGYVLNKKNKEKTDDLTLFKKVKYEFGFDDPYFNTGENIPEIEKNSPLFWNSYHTKSFKQEIFDITISGKIHAYDFITGKLLNDSSLSKNLIIKTDTIVDIDPFTGELIDYIIEDKITADRINSFIFIENWYIDKNTLSLKKEVIGIAPVIYNFENTEIEGQIPIKVIPFVLWFDESKRF